MAYSKYCLEGVINQIPVIFLLDTGAAVSLLRIDLWNRIRPNDLTTLQPYNDKKLIGAEGTPLRIYGSTVITATMETHQFRIPVVVVDQLTSEAILGLDFLKANGCVIDAAKGTVEFPYQKVSMTCLPPNKIPTATSTSASSVSPQVAVLETVQIPAHSELDISCV